MLARMIRARPGRPARRTAENTTASNESSRSDSSSGLRGLGGIARQLTLDPRSVTPLEVRRLQDVVGNHAIGQLLAARRPTPAASAPRIQRQVVLKQTQGDETPVGSFETLKKWLDRFGALAAVERDPLRTAKLHAMFEESATYTFPWLLGGEVHLFLDELDGVPLFQGAEYALPLIPRHGYALLEEMHHEAPSLFVSEARVRYAAEQFVNGKISSQVLAVASDQVAIQSKSADDQRKFEWACENLTVQMLLAPLTRENFSLLMSLHQKLAVTPTFTLLALVRICGADKQLRGMLYRFLQLKTDPAALTPGMLALPLTGENFSLLTALHQKLGITPTPALLSLVLHCGADNPLRGLLFEFLQLKVGVDALSTGLLDLVRPFSTQLIGHPDVLARAHTVAIDEPGMLAEYAPYSFIRENYVKAHAYGQEQAKSYRVTQTEALKQSVESEKAKAIAGQAEDAKKQLTKKQKKNLEAPPDSERHQEALKVLEARKVELAQDDLEKIEEGRKQREAEIPGEATIKGDEAVKEYQDFLNNPQVRHHPLAVAALELAKHDFAFAKKLVGALWQKPAIAPLVTQATLSAAEIDRCLGELSLDALAALLGSIQQTALKIFATTTRRLAALARLQQDGVSGPCLTQLSTSIKVFDPFLAPASAPALSDLLGVRGYSVVDVQKCLAMVPTDVRAKPDGALLVQTVAGHAAGAAVVMGCLALAERLNWKSGPIGAALNGLGQGLTEPALRDAMYQHLVDTRPSDSLRSWLDALEVPVEDGWAKVVKGDEDDLGVGNGGYRTIEWECSIEKTQGGQQFVTFVIHSHPGAQVSTNNPYGSKKHVKPTRWDTQTRLPFNESLGKMIYKGLGGS